MCCLVRPRANVEVCIQCAHIRLCFFCCEPLAGRTKQTKKKALAKHRSETTQQNEINGGKVSLKAHVPHASMHSDQQTSPTCACVTRNVSHLMLLRLHLITNKSSRDESNIFSHPNNTFTNLYTRTQIFQLSPSMSASDPTTPAGPAEPLTFLSISQNIGSIDCTGVKQVIPDEIQTMTKHFLQSLDQFLLDAAKAKRSEFQSNHHSSASPSASPFLSAMQSGFDLQPSASVVADGGGSDAPEIDVVIIHVQEIGGKKYNAVFNEYLGNAFRTMRPNAGWCSGLLMQPQNCDSTFTAMGVVIFLSKRVVPITSVLSVRHRTYVAVADDPISYTGGSAGSLFLGAKFSNAEKSRKGYLLTSLRIGNTCMNFVNLHLYHDADNATAAAESPSRYTPRRLEAFLEAMSEVIPVVNPDDPLFIFGDLNTRLDAKQTLEYLTTRLKLNEGDIKMGKKEVSAPESFWEFFMSRDNHSELHQFDREPAMLMDALAEQSGIELCELPIHFPPSYMLDDTLHDGRFHEQYGCTKEGGCRTNASTLATFAKKKLRPYKRERMPAWCDRIFMNTTALELITGVERQQQHRIMKQHSGARLKESASASSTAASTCTYDSVSLECMDHEGVFLLF